MIVFPTISCGVCFPLQKAAVDVTQKLHGDIKEIAFVLFDDKNFVAFRNAASITEKSVEVVDDDWKK